MEGFSAESSVEPNPGTKSCENAARTAPSKARFCVGNANAAPLSPSSRPGRPHAARSSADKTALTAPGLAVLESDGYDKATGTDGARRTATTRRFERTFYLALHSRF